MTPISTKWFRELEFIAPNRRQFNKFLLEEVRPLECKLFAAAERIAQLEHDLRIAITQRDLAQADYLRDRVRMSQVVASEVERDAAFKKGLDLALAFCRGEMEAWKSSRDPLPDDVQGARSACMNIEIAIRAASEQEGKL